MNPSTFVPKKVIDEPIACQLNLVDKKIFSSLWLLKLLDLIFKKEFLLEIKMVKLQKDFC